ncbi:MAG: hypothetical protein EA398_16295 [Deltaproteobacteria bacterium]|nr:MAG: hypothetical protein EA398_16295 [Deltaproteobacteria bacterium]
MRCRIQLRFLPFVLFLMAILTVSCSDDGGDPSEPGSTETGEHTETPSSAPPGTIDDTSDGPAATDPQGPSSQSSDVPPSLNACGGEGDIFYRGVAATPLQPCGVFDEGLLVCNGVASLRCVGESPTNACGGQGVLPSTVGDACGPCGEGTWVCAPDGDGVRCVGDAPVNACGGCGTIDGAPGEVCSDGGNDGLWICDAQRETQCLVGALNACGGTSTLQHDGADALPGEPCSLACGTGALLCDGAEALTCEPTADTEPENACGGCGPLPGEPGDGCGFCGNGAWACQADGTMTCEGADAPNACGGCEAVQGTPGEACGEEARWLCDGTSLSCTPRSSGALNACGGVQALDATPGEACGTCGKGVAFCASFEATACSVPDAEQENACGGCAALPGREGDACGDCGDGTLACSDDGEALTCEGAEQVRNACGGCGVALDNEPGTDCGTCGTWECASSMTVRCRGEADLNTDAENCGFCNNACLAGDSCVDGECAFINACGGEAELDGTPGEECGSCGTWACDGEEAVACEGDTDLQTDGENCGTCGNVCEGESGCFEGSCVAANACGGFSTLPAERGTTCEECGTWVCDGEDDLRCAGGADLQTDPLNCGACGDGCVDGELCEEGVCEVDRVVEVGVGNGFTCALRESGRVFCWGSSFGGRLGTGLTDVESLSVGNGHSCAITRFGRVLCWGSNAFGQLGNGDVGGQSADPVEVEGLSGVTAVSAGLDHTCAISNGAVWCWGSNAVGQLGDGTQEDSPVPVMVHSNLPSGAIAVAAGGDTNINSRRLSCALSSGEVWCWGAGALGDGGSEQSDVPVRVSALPSARDVTVGVASSALHACATTVGGSLYCWGNNERGQLGNGGTSSSTSAAATMPFGQVQSAAAGGRHTCALRSDGRVYCWGDGGNGVLGLGSQEQHNSPQQVPGIETAVSIATGFHTCAALESGQVACWGRNVSGELGDGQLASARWNRWLPVVSPFVPPVTSEYGLCYTGFDNSGNGLADCEDPSCAADLGDTLGEDLVSGQLIGLEGNYTQGSCSSGNADGPERVFGWTAPSDGTYRFAVESPSRGIHLYVRDESCLGTELGCFDGADPSLELELTEGQRVYVFVDTSRFRIEYFQIRYSLGITAVE